MSEAGRIAVRRRKLHKGATPKARLCRWCNGEVRGRKPLDEHERSCTARPSGELLGFTADDMIALRWTPPDAA